MKNKRGFTLTEILLALLIAGTLVGIILSIYMSIRAADQRMSNQRQLISQASDLVDRIHNAALYYTIDYEEYFNRQWQGLGPDGRGFSTYGNEGERYYCSEAHEMDQPYKVYRRTNEGCAQGGKQKFGEYGFQFRNLQTPEILNDKSNSKSNEGIGPRAIEPNRDLEYLYLINYDNTERYYFRRFYKEGDSSKTGKNDNLYTVQMLRLKGLDAGIKHDFDSWGAYDGFIDTRVCDIDQGFECKGDKVMVDDKEYHMPEDENDGWVDITNDAVTVNEFRADIYPEKDPYLATNESEYLISPYVKLSFTLNMYDIPSSEEITVTTTLGFKNSYYKYPIEQYDGYIPDDAY